MAYAAVTCLRTTILRLLESSRISVASSTRTNLESAYDELGSLRKVLERSGSSTPNSFEGQIIGAVQGLEDSLEFHELNQFLSQSQIYGDEGLMRDISFCVETVKKIKHEYEEELGESSSDQDDDDDDDPFEEEDEEEEEEEEDDRADGSGFSRDMIGFPDQFKEIKPYLVGKRSYVFSIVGMAGIGKTALAERIFQDSFILNRFESRVFISVGRKYELEEMKRSILAQLNPNYDMEKDDDERDLKKYLDEKRYLIVLDDVWDLGFWIDYFKHRRGDGARGSRILLTTRVEGVPYLIKRGTYFNMLLLNEVESWDLLRKKVFGEKVCPKELETAGKQIAEKCEGLPLTLVTVANFLAKAEATPEYWNDVALERNSVFEDAYELMLDVLYPSYDNLPPQAKSCFLYMGAFPSNCEVKRSKLVNLWCTEGFLEPDAPTLVHDFASECFDKINFDRVVVPAKQLSSDRQVYQACKLHSSFRHLCKKELKKNEFSHIVDGYGDDSTQGKPRKPRRLCIYSNVFFGTRDIGTLIESTPFARSLLCTGPYHEYQVPINFNLKLLRVCDTLTIRFYEFPVEALDLVQLAYFAITCNKTLPPSISILWKLEYLIVHEHLSIRTTVAESYLPVEIWNLRELKLLQIVGRNLPNPPCDAALPNLVTLLDVGTYSCCEGVLKSIPNLQKLRVRIELTPKSAEPDLSYLDHISQQRKLRSLKCEIVNPVLIVSQVVVVPSLSVYSSSITKLTLSGLGYPWEYLNNFLRLPNLEVLKLLQYAFQGEKWKVGEKGFLKLTCLTIEDSDLVQWRVGEGTFPCLYYLTLRYCYKLQELPDIKSYSNIELVDCNAAVEACANEKKCRVVSSSWDDPSDSKDYSSNIFTIY